MAASELTKESLDALINGYGDAEVVRDLRSWTLKSRIAQLGALVQMATNHSPKSAEWANLSSNFRLLRDVFDTQPNVIAEVILHPFVGTWITDVLRRLRNSDARSALGIDELKYLGWLTAAAVIKAHHKSVVPIAVDAGNVMLPGIGMAKLGGNQRFSSATVEVSAAGARIVNPAVTIEVPANPAIDTETWLGLRRLRSRNDESVVVHLDDLDPLRGLGLVVEVAPRLTADDVESWQAMFDGAWELLTRDHQHYIGALRAGLITIVPLARRGEGSLSATVRQAFGSIAAYPPKNKAELALLLVHEFQHAKMSVLSEAAVLYDDSNDNQLFYAPWRPDPRPLPALMQGIYAHFGVTDFWRVHRHISAGREATIAHTEFVSWRVQTLEAIESLRSADRFTVLGRQLLRRLGGQLQEWAAEPAPAEAKELAQEMKHERRIRWRLRNLILSPGPCERLAHAWAAGQTVPAELDLHVENSAMTIDSHNTALLRLLRTKIDDPTLSHNPEEQPGDPVTAINGWSQADLEYLNGNYRAAARQYASEIQEADDSGHLWIGLSISAQHLDEFGPKSYLFSRPEIVSSLFRAIRASCDKSPNPLDLASWLESSLPT
jgi:HEXXH motif-containing protein